MNNYPVVDVTSGGVLGSEGLIVKRISTATFHIEIGKARKSEKLCNMMQFFAVNPDRLPIHLEVTFPHDTSYCFDEYFHAATHDFKTFTPLHWQKEQNGKSNTMTVPQLSFDTFWVGMQFPMPYEVLCERLLTYQQHPDVTITSIGHSFYGRNLYKLVVAASNSPIPESQRWVHYVSNQHPGEGSARWRMVGMLDQLLSEESRSTRERAIFHFVFMLCPDGPAYGWRRNASNGVDMNRCWSYEGEPLEDQPIEGKYGQEDIERLMQSKTPIDTFWSMHTWPGATDPLLHAPGPEVAALGEVDLLSSLFEDEAGEIIKPLQIRDAINHSSTWNSGIHTNYGVTSFLIEGGGNLEHLEDHLESGKALLRVIDRFWKGSRADIN